MKSNESTYQVYDFIKDINFHISRKNPIILSSKSEAFKTFLFKLKIFPITNKIKKSDPLFEEDYFIIIMYGVAYVAKRIDSDEPKFDYVEIKDGLKIIRLAKMNKIFN